MCAAGAAAGLWLAALRLTASGHAATLAWVGAAASAPFVFNSITVYPEIPAAACAMAAYLLATRRGSLVDSPRLAVGCGLILGMLPWLSSKYSLMMAALAALALGRMWLPSAGNGEEERPTPRSRAGERIRVSLALTLPILVSVALWLAFWTLSRLPCVPPPKDPRYGTQPWVTGWAERPTLKDRTGAGLCASQPRLMP